MREYDHMLITGGAGFIGSHLADNLIARGYRVTVIDDLSTGKMQNLQQSVSSPLFSFIEGNIIDNPILDSLVRQADVVFHLAAAVGVDYILSNRVESIARCVEGTRPVFEAASRYGKKVIFTSTSEVYGRSGALPFVESGNLVLGTPQTFRWSYACSKALDEFMALAFNREQGLDVVIPRLFNTVGPRQSAKYGMVLPRFLNQALRNQPLTVFGDGSQSRCFCYVEDVVRALIDLMHCPAAVGEIVNVGSTEEVTIDALAQRVIIQTSSLSDIENIPLDLARGEGFADMQRRVPDLQKVAKLIGWQPRYRLESIIDKMAMSLQMQQDEKLSPSQRRFEKEN